MKLVTSRLGAREVAKELPKRIADAHATWFGVQGNAWAKEHIFGIENNHDLGLAAKVNMVLHGDGSMNTWINSGLLPFGAYFRKEQSNVLGIAHDYDKEIYGAPTNEQFDLIISNPPFSLTMSADEERKLEESFTALVNAPSEQIFLERWYQLLGEGGKFCCVLPETILDTASNIDTRLFLYQFFRIHAVVSLPYVTFRPFTSTKTCIVLAEKRTTADARAFKQAWDRVAQSRKTVPQEVVFGEVIEQLNWSEDRIFMAEPVSVGYKRRKGLPDLHDKNDLYSESADGGVDPLASARTVLSSYLSGSSSNPSLRLGFETNLKQIGLRRHLRLDPKYRWLWDRKKGVALGQLKTSRPLSEILEVVKLPRVEKGKLASEALLIDLEHVESRQALIVPDIPRVDVIGSQKVRFVDCDLAISKLEPYLGKILIRPPADAVGSTEWIGLRCKTSLPLEYIAHLLMLPELCEAYRCLQSGKRHARFDATEFLDLRVRIPGHSVIERIQEQIERRRMLIVNLRDQERLERASIDRLY